MLGHSVGTAVSMKSEPPVPVNTFYLCYRCLNEVVGTNGETLISAVAAIG